MIFFGYGFFGTIINPFQTIHIAFFWGILPILVALLTEVLKNNSEIIRYLQIIFYTFGSTIIAVSIIVYALPLYFSDYYYQSWWYFILILCFLSEIIYLIEKLTYKQKIVFVSSTKMPN
jgi:hypothetical protein